VAAVTTEDCVFTLFFITRRAQQLATEQSGPGGLS